MHSDKARPTYNLAAKYNTAWTARGESPASPRMQLEFHHGLLTPWSTVAVQNIAGIDVRQSAEFVD